MRNTYSRAGLALLVVGVLISLAANFVLQLPWLTALGIAMLILAFVLIVLSRTIPSLSPEMCRLLLETGTDNIAAIVEEIGLRTRAVYLPSSLAGGQPRALLPLHANPTLPPIKKPLPRRLIVRYGDRADDIGLLVSTVGSSAVSMLDTPPASNPDSVGVALARILTGTLGLADGANVTRTGNAVKIEITNPGIGHKPTLYEECLGGPIASIAASVAAEAWQKPVKFNGESYNQGKCCVELEVLE